MARRPRRRIVWAGGCEQGHMCTTLSWQAGMCFDDCCARCLSQAQQGEIGGQGGRPVGRSGKAR